MAQLYKLSCTGTLGVLIKGKELGYIDQVLPLIQQLQSQGMWLSNKLIEQVLCRAGEI
jgi:predicted nucleic acid-binding protein